MDNYPMGITLFFQKIPHCYIFFYMISQNSCHIFSPKPIIQRKRKKEKRKGTRTCHISYNDKNGFKV